MILKIKKICPTCKQPFWREKWRHQKFCSLQCGVDFHKGKKYEERKCLNCGKVFKVEAWRKQRFCSRKCGIDFNRGKPKWIPPKSKGKKIRNRPERKLKDGRRIALHRYLMEEKINRQLDPKEQVHHKDIDFTNNNIENLWLYKNGREHTQGHKSLEKLVSSLMKDKIIGFKNGKYFRIRRRG